MNGNINKQLIQLATIKTGNREIRGGGWSYPTPWVYHTIDRLTEKACNAVGFDKHDILAGKTWDLEKVSSDTRQWVLFSVRLKCNFETSQLQN